MVKKTVYRAVAVTEDLIELVEAQAEAVNLEMLGRFLAEIEAEGATVRINSYKGSPQATIFGVGRGENGEDVGVSGTGGTYAEALLMAYTKVHSVLDWDFGVSAQTENQPANRWG